MAPEKGWKQARKKFELAICEHCGLDINNHGIGFASKRVAARYRGAVDHIVLERLALCCCVICLPCRNWSGEGQS